MDRPSNRNGGQTVRKRLCKPDALLAQCIYVWCSDPGVTVDSDVVSSEIVQHDHDDVHSVYLHEIIDDRTAGPLR